MKPGMVCLSVTCPTFLHLYHDPFPSTDSQNHLLCPSLESRFSSHAFVLRVGSCDSWESGPAMGRSLWVTQWFPIAVLVTRKRRTSNRSKEERDEAIEWSVWILKNLANSLCQPFDNGECCRKSCVIITALKLTLLQSCSLGSHNFSHIELCEDVYILVRPHVSIGRSYSNTCCARTSLHHHLYPVFRSKLGSCLIWYIPYDGLPRRWKNKKNRKRKSAKRDTRSCARTTQRVHRVSCFMHDRGKGSLSRGWMIFTRIRQINICWQEWREVNGDLPDLLGLKVRSNCVRAAAYLKYITLIYFTNEI